MAGCSRGSWCPTAAAGARTPGLGGIPGPRSCRRDPQSRPRPPGGCRPGVHLGVVRLPEGRTRGAGPGTEDTYRGEIDLSTPFNASGSVRGRLVGAKERRGDTMDLYKKKRDVLYGIIEADVAEATTVSVGGSVQRTRPSGISCAIASGCRQPVSSANDVTPRLPLSDSRKRNSPLATPWPRCDGKVYMRLISPRSAARTMAPHPTATPAASRATANRTPSGAWRESGASPFPARTPAASAPARR